MVEFKYKLQYVYQFATRNHSIDQDTCTALFLTFFTTPSWVPIGCDDVLPNSYFICERQTIELQPKINQYLRNSTTCPKMFTYAEYDCWKIKRDIRTKIEISTIPYALQFMLSSWAFDRVDRTQITLSTNTKHCLITYDFKMHRVKTWTKSNKCALNNYVLTKQTKITYTYLCHGEEEV